MSNTNDNKLKTSKRKIQDMLGLLPWESKKARKVEVKASNEENTSENSGVMKFFGSLFFEQRSQEEIDAENLYNEDHNKEFMDLYEYIHPRPPQKAVAMGNKKLAPRNTTTVSAQMKLMLKKKSI